MVELRGLVNELISYQLEDYPDAEISAKQAELNAAYNVFTAKYGLLNDRKNGRLFEDDSSYYLLCSLENLDENGRLKSKADMFTKRTIRPERTVTHVDTPRRGAGGVHRGKGRVDLSLYGRIAGHAEDFERITEELRGAIFQDPFRPELENRRRISCPATSATNCRSPGWLLRNDPTFAVNVEALTKAQPKELEASEIDVRLGATWISARHHPKVMNETFPHTFLYAVCDSGQIFPSTAEWRIEGKTKTGRN